MNDRSYAPCMLGCPHSIPLLLLPPPLPDAAGTFDSVLSSIGASNDGLLRFITEMCPSESDRRNIASNFLCSFKDVLLAGKYLVSSRLYHGAITRELYMYCLFQSFIP